MTKRTFKKACEIACYYGDTIVLGGGEPTLHPLFEEFLGIAMIATARNDLGIYIATNGTNEYLTLNLLELSKRSEGLLCCQVSHDNYHEMDLVSDKVYELAEKYHALKPAYHIAAAGRAKGKLDAEKRCCCDDLFINPHGDVYLCGCRISKLCNITHKKNISIIEKYYNNYDIEDKCEKYGDILQALSA
jgi:MoaA/NifB/PqqE/SkfB family radical SAM enzyme